MPLNPVSLDRKLTTMRFEVCILILLNILVHAQEFKEGGSISPYGPASDEIQGVVSRAIKDKNPEILRELASFPLEQTFEVLEHAARNTNAAHPDLKALVPAARDTLYNHPGFENFMQRTLRKMTQISIRDGKRPIKPDGELDILALKARPQPVRTAQEDLEYKITERLWLNMLGTVQVLPSHEMQIRLLGPCLENSDYWLLMEGYGGADYGIANHVAGRLAGAIRKVTGEIIPYTPNGYSYDVNFARAWWKRNEAKYRWTPPWETPAAQPQIAPPTPLPKRVPLNAKTTAGAERDGKPAGADSAEATAQSPAARYWPLFMVAGLLVLLALGIFLSARGNAK